MLTRTAIVVVLVGGCFGAASVPVAHPGAQSIQVFKSDPQGRCTDLGPIEGVHGSGCGAFGHKGTYEGAYVELKNVAAARGATYVRMDSQIPPHSESACFDDSFVIRGVAFRCEPSHSEPSDPQTAQQ